jgi:hypothetical protein
MDGHRGAIWLEQFCKQNVPAGQTTDRDVFLDTDVPESVPTRYSRRYTFRYKNRYKKIVASNELKRIYNGR